VQWLDIRPKGCIFDSGSLHLKTPFKTEAVMPEKKFKQVCECEKCGNEAEMMITCSLVPEEDKPEEKMEEAKVLKEKKPGTVEGHAVCTRCGSEADIWIDTSGI
jgi:DNA-directed RNA polymerase subunit M/transcription elongation factor TFIIS